MLVGIIICIVFAILAVLMIRRKIPAILALPIMAVAIAAVSGMPLAKGDENIFSTVIVSGATRLITNAVYVIFASWLSSILYKTGITDLMIKKAAELGGDKPAVITLLLIAVSTVLFSGMGGVGAVAMVGGTVLPILISIGIKPMAAAHLFLCALSAGYNIRPANVKTLCNIVGIEITDITVACWILLVADLLFAVIYLFVYLKKNGKKYAFAAPVNEEDEDLKKLQNKDNVRGVRAFLAALTPVLVVAVTYIFKWDVIVCYIIGILWAIVMTAKGKWDKYVSMITQSAYEGISDSAPAIMIFMGIGMVLTAVGSSTVQAALLPFMDKITPSSVAGLLIFCAVLSPLSLYRGPFNVLGLGSCLLASIIALGHFDPILLGAVFYCTFRWPAQACPTATQVVWVSNYVGQEPISVTNKVLIPNWVLTAVTVIIVGLIYA